MYFNREDVWFTVMIELLPIKDIRKNKKKYMLIIMEMEDFICGLQMVGRNMKF